MALRLSSLQDLSDLAFDTLIDVRSPAEFAEDHLPGAVNLPALSNEERAEVGMIYTQDSPFKARKIGAAMVSRNMAWHLETALSDKDGAWKPLVYCWRGGQRSGSVATILSQIGWRAETLEGGYQSYRRLVVKALYDDPWPGPLLVLDGNTGSGKTAVLHRLSKLGIPVLDLEGLGGHRGSVLGPMATPQPMQKAFESGIVRALISASVGQPIVVEAESSKVGDLIVPPGLWAAMRQAPRVLIEAPAAARAQFLCGAYADLVSDPQRFSELLAKLKPYHGREMVAEWQAMVQSEDHTALALSLVEHHYDPRYAKARSRHDAPVKATLKAARLGDADLDALASEIASLTQSQ